MCRRVQNVGYVIPRCERRSLSECSVDDEQKSFDDSEVDKQVLSCADERQSACMVLIDYVLVEDSPPGWSLIHVLA